MLGVARKEGKIVCQRYTCNQSVCSWQSESPAHQSPLFCGRVCNGHSINGKYVYQREKIPDRVATLIWLCPAQQLERCDGAGL